MLKQSNGFITSTWAGSGHKDFAIGPYSCKTRHYCLDQGCGTGMLKTTIVISQVVKPPMLRYAREQRGISLKGKVKSHFS